MFSHRYNHLCTSLLLLGLAFNSMAVLAERILGEKISLSCTESASTSCMAGGVFNSETELFTGTYMCRETSYRLFWKRNTTVCVPTIEKSVLAERGDVCGCCDADGNPAECPQPCTCRCSMDDNYNVLLYKENWIGKKTRTCVSQAKATRMIADIRLGDYRCVPDNEECPIMLSTTSPTTDPDESLQDAIEIYENLYESP